MNKSAKNKQTILITTSTFPRSETDSIPRFVLDLAQSISSQYEVIVLTPHIPGTRFDELYGEIQVVRYQYLPERFETLIGEGGILPRIRQNPLRIFQIPFLLRGQVKALDRLTREHEVSLIHAQWFFPQGPIAARIAKKRNIPFGVTAHGSDINQLQSPFFKYMYKKVIKQASLITAVSDSLSQQIQSLESTQVAVISMGINQGYFEVKREEVDTKSIISVGRLDKQKGFQDVIQVLPQLPEYHYTIIGEGSDRQYLISLAKKYNVADRVYLVGSKTPEEIMEYYRTAGLFILPSRTEGFGLSVVEAMAAGVPVITSDILTLVEHTRKGDGISIHTQDTSQIISAINQVEKINRENAQGYAKQFSWESIGQKFSAVYHNTLNQ